MFVENIGDIVVVGVHGQLLTTGEFLSHPWCESTWRESPRYSGDTQL